MAAETELERLVVRLIGDSTLYQKAIDDAIKAGQQYERELTNQKKAQQENNKALADAARVIDSVRTPIERYEKDLASLDSHLTSGRISQEDYRRAVAKLDAEFKKSLPAARDYGATISSVGATVAKAGAVLSASVTAPLALLGHTSTAAASNLRESINAVQVTFGEGADTILKFGKTADQAAGLSQRAFNELATTTGTLLINLGGFSTQDAAKEMTSLAQRASDMASVFNTEVPDAMAAIGSALRGETEPIRRYGVSVDIAAIKSKALELGLVGANEELSRQVKTQAALAIIYDQTNRTAGDFANTSQDVANATRRLMADFENIKAEIGDRLIPFKSKLINVGERLLRRWEGLSEESKNLAVQLGVTAAAVGPLTVGFGTTLLVGGKVLSLLPKLGISFTLAGAQAAAAWAAATLGVSLLVTGLVGLGLVLVEAQRQFGVFDPFIKSAKEAWATIKEQLTPAIKELSDFLATEGADTFQEVTEATAELVRALEPLIPLAGIVLKSSLEDTVRFIRGVVIPTLEFMAQQTKLVADNIGLLLTATGLGALTNLAGQGALETKKLAEETDKAAMASKSLAEETEKAAAALEAGDMEKAAMAAADEAKELEKLQDKVDKFTQNLHKEIATRNMSTREAQLWAIQQEVGGQIALDAAEKLTKQLMVIDEQKEAMKEHQKILDQGAKLTEHFLTPQEKFNRKIADLNKLLDVIGPTFKNTFTLAVREAAEELEKTQKKAHIELTVGGLDAIRGGTKEFDELVRNTQKAVAAMGTPDPIDQIVNRVFQDRDTAQLAARDERGQQRVDDWLARADIFEPTPQDMAPRGTNQAVVDQAKDKSQLLLDRIAQATEAQANRPVVELETADL